MIALTQAQREEIGHHGTDTFPYECCGVMLGDVENQVKIVREIRPLDNIFEPDAAFEASVLKAEEVPVALPEVGQERRFRIDPDQMFRLMQEERRTKRKILGFYHSHPNHPAYPSAYDLEWASPWYSYIIVSVIEGQVSDLTSWTLETSTPTFEAEDIL